MSLIFSFDNVIGKKYFGQKSLNERGFFELTQDSTLYCVGNKKEPIENLCIDGSISSFYVGKMFYNKENIYSKDFFLGFFDVIFARLSSGTKILIQLGPSLSEIINGPEDICGAMTFLDQKKFLYNLIASNFKNGLDRVNIENIEDRHTELFSFLRKYGVNGLKTENKPNLDLDKFCSLDIAKYLYWVMSSNNSFYKKISATKPTKLKESSKESSDYYGMIELSIRIYDFLCGIDLHLGERRQNRYDEIIKFILYQDLEKRGYPELIDLQNFCKKIVSNRSFSTLHFDSRKYLEILKKHKLKKIIKNSTFALVFLLSGAFAGVVGDHIYTNNLKEKRIENVIIRMLSKYELGAGFGVEGKSILLEKRKTLFVDLISVLYDRLLYFLNDGNNFSDDLKILLLNDLFSSKDFLIRMIIMHSDGIYNYDDIDYFLLNVFIPRNNITLINYGFNYHVKPKTLENIPSYNTLFHLLSSEYYENILRTFFLYIDINNGSHSYLKNIEEKNITVVKNLGNYFSKNGDEYNLFLVNVTVNDFNDTIVLATKLTMDGLPLYSENNRKCNIDDFMEFISDFMGSY